MIRQQKELGTNDINPMSITELKQKLEWEQVLE